MRLDVFFTPLVVKPSDTSGRLVAIVDVLRAATTVATALGNGAKTVIPVEGADEVISRSKEFARSQILLAGEHGASVVTLGPRLLRSEVAAVAAIAQVLYEFESERAP